MPQKSHIRKLADKRAMLWRERGFEQVIERDCELIGYLAGDGRGLTMPRRWRRRQHDPVPPYYRFARRTRR